MELQNLKVLTRSNSGKGVARRARSSGNVPGILYGGEGGPVSLTVDFRDFLQLIHGRQGEHAVVNLNVEDNPKLNTPALLKSVQHHPVKGHVVHFDLQRIRLDEKIQTVVTITLKGRPKGVIEGGVMDHQLRELEIECLATHVPDEIVVDVSDLGIGDSAHVASVPAPEGVTILTDPERTIAAVLASRLTRTAEEEEAEAAAAAAEGAEAAEGESAES